MCGTNGARSDLQQSISPNTTEKHVGPPQAKKPRGHGFDPHRRSFWREAPLFLSSSSSSSLPLPSPPLLLLFSSSSPPLLFLFSRLCLWGCLSISPLHWWCASLVLFPRRLLRVGCCLGVTLLCYCGSRRCSALCPRHSVLSRSSASAPNRPPPSAPLDAPFCPPRPVFHLSLLRSLVVCFGLGRLCTDVPALCLLSYAPPGAPLPPQLLPVETREGSSRLASSPHYSRSASVLGALAAPCSKCGASFTEVPNTRLHYILYSTRPHAYLARDPAPRGPRNYACCSLKCRSLCPACAQRAAFAPRVSHTTSLRAARVYFAGS